MKLAKRALMGALVFAPAIVGMNRVIRAAAAKTLKISHQFPGGTADAGDFRDRLCRKFAAAVEAKTQGEIACEVYPASSLVKTVAQFSQMSQGKLDMSFYALAYSGGEVKELIIA